MLRQSTCNQQLESLSTTATVNVMDAENTTTATVDVLVSVSKRPRSVGLCRVCKRQIHVTTTGVLYKHGPGCAGSGVHPVDGSVMDIDGNSQQKRSASGDSANSVDEMTSDDFLNQLRDGMRCRLLKRIPKASRLAAAEKLAQLLSAIITNPDNLQAWIDLMLFPSCCLKVPDGRGGRKHQKALAGKLKEVIRVYPCVASGNNGTALHQSCRSRAQIIQQTDGA